MSEIIAASMWAGVGLLYGWLARHQPIVLWEFGAPRTVGGLVIWLLTTTVFGPIFPCCVGALWLVTLPVWERPLKQEKEREKKEEDPDPFMEEAKREIEDFLKNV